jgi:hypothetical protein
MLVIELQFKIASSLAWSFICEIDFGIISEDIDYKNSKIQEMPDQVLLVLLVK